jgi:hypothetical protein
MTTAKQIEANRRNALLSTGAVTECGKTTVSKNAIKHGIFTSALVIGDGIIQETVLDYNELLLNLTKSLNPTDQMESLLVEKIAVDFWRLKRVIKFESHCISDPYNGLTVANTLPNYGDDEKVTRYERSLQRSIMQILLCLKSCREFGKLFSNLGLFCKYKFYKLCRAK